MSNHLIPLSTISLISDFLSDYETHASIDSLLMYTLATGEAPQGSKPVKVKQRWSHMFEQLKAYL
jgi:hypothetical protein